MPVVQTRGKRADDIDYFLMGMRSCLPMARYCITAGITNPSGVAGTLNPSEIAHRLTLGDYREVVNHTLRFAYPDRETITGTRNSNRRSALIERNLQLRLRKDNLRAPGLPPPAAQRKTLYVTLPPSIPRTLIAHPA